MREIRAKSKQQGWSTLYNHSISVYNIATRMSIGLSDDISLLNDVRISSIFHDIGKSTNSFQLYIDGKVDKSNGGDIILHNEISWAYLHECGYNDNILNAVLYHHPTYKDDNRICDILDSISDDDFIIMGEMYKRLHSYIDNNSLNKAFNRTGNNDECGYPAYFEFDSNKFRSNNLFPDSNTRVLFIKACLISADRLVSELEYKHDIRIDSIINNDLGIIDSIIEGCIMMDKEYYLQCPSHFDINRFHIQQKSSLEATKKKLMIIQAPAGYGKTIIGLDYITTLKYKAIWVCPRNIIATSTYESIIRELGVFGLCMRISLLLSDEVKACNFKSDNIIQDSDIVVTNIDNYLVSTVKNDHQNRLYNLIGSTVIFDEFHELVDSTAIFAGFLNVVRCRDKYCDSHTLLMSATPMKLETRLRDNSVGKISIDSFNDSEYKIIVHDISEVFNPTIDGDSLIIHNSISLAQDMYKENMDKSSLLHSLYITNDLNSLRDEITTNHDKYSIIDNRRPVIGCRIIGTGLDISFLTLHESVSTPEYTLQSIGRVNRFNEYKDISTPSIHIHFNDDKPERGAIEINSTLAIRNLWYNFIKDNANGRQILIKDIYNLYNKFYESSGYITLYNKLIKEKLSESLESYSKLKPFRNNKKFKNNKIIKISKHSLRSSGKQIFAIARMKGGSGFMNEPIQINIERVSENEKRMNNERNKVIKKMVEYDYNVYKKPLSEDKMIENAVWNTKPYVLLTYEYDKNIGLYKI